MRRTAGDNHQTVLLSVGVQLNVGRTVCLESPDNAENKTMNVVSIAAYTTINSAIKHMIGEITKVLCVIRNSH